MAVLACRGSSAVLVSGADGPSVRGTGAVCYVRVGVGSAVSSRLLLSGREQVRDNELSWVSASHRGHFISSMKASNSGHRPIFKLLSFLSVGTKQQPTVELHRTQEYKRDLRPAQQEEEAGVAQG